MLWEEDIACTDAVATAAMSVMLLMTAGAAAGLMSSRIWLHDMKPRVVSVLGMGYPICPGSAGRVRRPSPSLPSSAARTATRNAHTP